MHPNKNMIVNRTNRYFTESWRKWKKKVCTQRQQTNLFQFWETQGKSEDHFIHSKNFSVKTFQRPHGLEGIFYIAGIVLTLPIYRRVKTIGLHTSRFQHPIPNQPQTERKHKRKTAPVLNKQTSLSVLPTHYHQYLHNIYIALGISILEMI